MYKRMGGENWVWNINLTSALFAREYKTNGTPAGMRNSGLVRFRAEHIVARFSSIWNKGPVRFVDQKEPEPENSLSLVVGNMPEPIKR